MMKHFVTSPVLKLNYLFRLSAGFFKGPKCPKNEGIQGNSWRCAQKKCLAKLTIDKRTSTILKENPTLNHKKSQNSGRESFKFFEEKGDR